jgi:hypothetical protein
MVYEVHVQGKLYAMSVPMHVVEMQHTKVVVAASDTCYSLVHL